MRADSPPGAPGDDPLVRPRQDGPGQTDRVDREALRRRYEELSQWPLVGLAVLFVVAYA